MREKLVREIEAYVPVNAQEEADRRLMLDWLKEETDVFNRNARAHFTASAWVCNKTRDKVLLAYHNLYDSWAWLGGHADGEADLLKVAMKEVREESGVRNLRPLTGKIASLEALTVDGHEKKGRYVSSHIHLNVTYILEADEQDVIRIKADENKAVGWFTPEEALKASTEEWFVKRIYSKLNDRLKESIN